ncbi:MAG: phosphohistidine phosphatase SixA [Cyanobacteria bacterium]|nr:phosphohistidine phosphatase SixA [Cyanobacteria bacterium CG_2015-16_32_12]NCO77361.1 phosphohistidine phosphatase SixA [Cyanobacteria bacterium CG_2015-22_32_23]NCQ04411.1 phosphohistidine phosphatase SixA [Cyanobacteria bacterium CG_2015-09_32_10]NCQ40666.1 phosphohistidine phosphatase SixA [Cyanobacteria bacterium CG_2015-04_32_10]NCS85423.1 phosphohistidine phosphatase SixA [Cyanobacteria bacterium CG_2015-02_32_10]
MKIYLIRHGIAESRNIEENDPERILTSKGITRVQKVTQKLSTLKIKFDVIISSPYTRAKETAIILQQGKLTSQIIEHSALKPEGNILEWINWLQNSDYKDSNSIALVGHQPDLTNWTELLIWGEIQGKLILKKAGIIGLDLLDLSNPIGTSELFLLAGPKWITN